MITGTKHIDELLNAKKECETKIMEAINEFLSQSGSVNVSCVGLTAITYQVSKQLIIDVQLSLEDNSRKWDSKTEEDA